MIRVCLVGTARSRQPLAYPPIRDQCRQIVVVEDPARADILMIGHSNDLRRDGAALFYLMAAQPHLQLVLLSEEPYWDTLAAKNPFETYQTFATPPGPLPYVFLNHHTSAIYDFERIPSFLLTDPRYIAHYRPRFARNARLSPQDWGAHFRRATIDAAFMAEKRGNPRSDIRFPGRDVFGLSHFRTVFTQACRGRSVLRAGRGWEVGPARQALADWHDDKLTRLDLRCRFVSALENTHQRNYVSEKIFDAYAVGGVPIYCAGPGQGVERVAGPDAWVNIYGQAAEAGFDAEQEFSAPFLTAYAATQAALHDLFASPDAVPREMDRLAGALTATLRALLP